MDNTEEQTIKVKILRMNIVKVIKNNTSLQMTVPFDWREVHFVEGGDLIEIALLGIVKKNKKNEKNN